MQKTDFPYFAVVHDDCSTDGSVAIIKEYQEKYPEKIVPIFETENCYTKDWSIADKRIMDAYGDAKYIAICEGDDYWTNPNKLQLQVDFLESHPEYSMCTHETIMTDERYHRPNVKFSAIRDKSIIPPTKSDYSFDEILRGNIFHYSSLLFRHEYLIVFPQWRYRLSAGDMVLSRYLGLYGKAHWFSEAMSVYRGHEGSVTSTESSYNSALLFNELNILVLRLLNRFWERKWQNIIYPIIALYYAECAWLYTKKRMRDIKQCGKMLRVAMMYNRLSTLEYISKRIINKIFIHR